MKVADPTRPCSEQSQVAREPIFGTAVPDVETWLLIEYRERWAERVLECQFPVGVLEWLERVQKRTRRLRIQLIKPIPGAEAVGPLNVFVVNTGAHAQIKRLTIDALENLPNIDFEQVVGDLANAASMPSGVRSKPSPRALYLVCTHGKRDRCCALHGVALCRRLSEQAVDGQVWQTTHLGGHRFAATMIYLPLGIHYGRLSPDDAQGVVEAHQRGSIYDLRCYRGLSRENAAVQTAEAWLREQATDMRIGAFVPVSSKMLSSGQWSASFRTPRMLHHVTMTKRVGAVARMKSCNATESELPAFFDVVRHEAQTLL